MTTKLDLGLPGVGLSRRSFLRTTALVGGALLLDPMSLAMSEAQAAPARGGTLRIAIADTPKMLDPQAAVAFADYQLSSMIFDNLTVLDNNVQPQPALALSWTAENGAQEWVFELRQGVKFHHGREFTAEDVVATLKRAADPAKALISRGYYGPIADVVAEASHRVRIILDKPFAELPVQLGSHLARILPADHLDDQATNPIGTGPFKFQEIKVGTSVSVVRNENYWRDGLPYLDGVRMVVMREQMAQQAALRSNTVDIITRVPTEAALTLRNVKGIRLYSVPSGDHHAMITQANIPPFDNPKVREAFKYILDREALIPSVLLGQGTPGNEMPMPPGNFYLPDLEPRKQDLEKAKRLIEESGLAPLEIDLYTSSERPPAPKLAVAFQEAAAKIGVKVNVRDVPYTEYAANVARKMPFYTSQWSANATAYEMLYLKYHSTGPFNYSKLEQGPGVDALLDEMVAEVDVDKRKALVKEISLKIRDNSERIIPYFLNYIGATTEKVNGFKPPKFNAFDVTEIWLGA